MHFRKWKNSSSDTAYTYNSWYHMLDRCYNPDADQFEYYGGRGILVCNQWRSNYDTFFEDMGERPKGTTLERINNDLGYFPENCRWATRKEQALNRGDSQMHSPHEMMRVGCTTLRGLRYWEDQGLLGDVDRTNGNVRRYTDEQLDRARIIAAAQFGGWSLEEIKAMVTGYDREVHEALLVRLSDQARAAARLAESLPRPPEPVEMIDPEETPAQVYDL